MATQSVMSKSGIKYYSLEAAAKLAGLTKPALKGMLGKENIEYELFKATGPIWILASSLDCYLAKRNGKS